MVARLLTGFRHAVRPALLAMMAAVAWLVLGAGTAQAALPAPDTGAILQQAASSPVVESVPLPVPPVIADGGDAAMATAPAPVSPVTGLSDAPVTAADSVLTGTTDAVGSLALAVPPVEQLLPVPVPEVLPLPEILPLPEPLPSLLPAVLPAPVQVLLPDLITLPTAASGPVPAAPRGIPAPGAALDPGVSVPLSAAEPQEGTAGAPSAVTPEALDGSAGTVRTFGFSPAQDRAGSRAVPGVTGALRIPPGAPGTPGPLRISALPGHAGSAGPTSHGGAGSFGGAADIAGSWPELPATTGATDRPGADALPASPSFDPGSSPD
jgi:hypothetical protein